jgi:VIT1/CCC1 family predicted Fe2+/Mn2+ transporter
MIQPSPNATQQEAAQPMPVDATKSSKRVLEPVERVSEVLFGLIMVLTFTGSLSVAEAGREDVRVMLIGALGCNIAWGVIDGVLYLMGCLAEKGRNLMTYRAVRNATDPQKAQQLIAEALPAVLASVLQPAELEAMHQRLQKLPEPPERAKFARDDWLGALGVFVWVFVTTFPVAIPFIFIKELATAMRASNGVAIVMLFVSGAAYGRCVGRSPWVFGISMVVLGLVVVALTIALGG